MLPTFHLWVLDVFVIMNAVGSGAGFVLSFRDKLFCFAVLVAETLLYLSNDMYLGGVNSIKETLGLTDKHIAMSMTAWFVGSSSFPLIVGAVSRYVNKNCILLFGMGLFCVGNLLGGLVSSLFTLLLCRFCQGACVAFIVTVGYAIIHERYPSRAVIGITSIMSSISVIAPSFGPMVGALVSISLGWRWMFWFLLLANSLPLFLFLSSSPSWKHVKNDGKNVSFVGVLRDYITIIKNRRFLRLSVTSCLTFMPVLYWILGAPFLVVSNMGGSEVLLGVVQIVSCLGFPVGAFCLNRMMRMGISIHRILLIGMFLGLLGAILFFLCAYFGCGLWFFVMSTIVMIVGDSICYSPLNRVVIEVEPSFTSQLSALLSNMIGLSGVLLGLVLFIITDFGFLGFAIVAVLLWLASLAVYLSGKPAVLMGDVSLT